MEAFALHGSPHLVTAMVACIQGMMTVSRVGFNEAKGQALVYVGIQG